MVDSK
jgi:hypothetical protein